MLRESYRGEARDSIIDAQISLLPKYKKASQDEFVSTLKKQASDKVAEREGIVEGPQAEAKLREMFGG